MATLSPSQLRKIKAELRDRLQDELQGKAIELQDALYEIVVEKFIDEFTLSSGVITFDDDNIKASEAVEKIFTEFNKKDMKKFVARFVSEIGQLTDISVKYHETMSEDLSRFRDITKEVKKLMYFRLGLKSDGTLIKKGFLYNFGQNSGLKDTVMQKMMEQVTKQQPKSEMLALLKREIKGDKPETGAMVKYFKEKIYNVYSQYDNAMSKTFADELKLKAFIFAGGIINTSREFCIEKNDKVFTIEEADKWVDDPKLPRTKKEKETGKVVGYDPLINFGRWEGQSDTCRHHANFISNAEAIRRRPDLAGKL